MRQIVRKKQEKFLDKDENLKKMMLKRMANSSDEKIGKKINIDQDIAEMLSLVSTEKETTKESIADDIMSFYFKKLYDLRLSDKVDNIELGEIDIVDIEFNKKNHRVTQNIKMKKNIAKILKFTSVKDAITQGEVFENASIFYFKKIYSRRLKDKINEIESGKIVVVNSNQVEITDKDKLKKTGVR